MATITLNEVWFPGDTHEPDAQSDAWTAGIHIQKADGKIHWNAIEFYGATKELAEARRNQVLTSLAFQHGNYDAKCIRVTISYVNPQE